MENKKTFSLYRWLIPLWIVMLIELVFFTYLVIIIFLEFYEQALLDYCLRGISLIAEFTIIVCSLYLFHRASYVEFNTNTIEAFKIKKRIICSVNLNDPVFYYVFDINLMVLEHTRFIAISNSPITATSISRKKSFFFSYDFNEVIIFPYSDALDSHLNLWIGTEE